MTSGQQGKERKDAKVGDKLRHDPEVRAGQSHVGSETSHHSGIRHPQAAEYHENYDSTIDPKTGEEKDRNRKPLPDTERNEYGAPVKFKKPKESTGGAARDIKRAMDLAILKCKNFKIKYHNYKNPNSYDANAGDNPVWRKDVESKTTIEDASGKETKPEKVADRYRKPTKKTSDEIVAKAIELINEAYDQIGKDSVTGKQSKEGKPKHESGVDSKRTDNTSVAYGHNSPNLDVSGVKEGAEFTDSSGRINTQWSEGQEPQDFVAQGDKTAEEDYDKKWNKMVDDVNWGKDRHGSLEPSKLPPPKEGKGALGKGDSAVTTSTEGTNNPVNAGKKESFGKTLDTQGRKDEYTKEEHAEHDSQKAEKEDPYHVSEYLDSLSTRKRDERNNTWRPHPDDNTPKDDY